MGLPLSMDWVEWFGRGPGETYNDKKLSQHFGKWESSVQGLFVDYEFPQETGNRTDVRRVKFCSTKLSNKYDIIAFPGKRHRRARYCSKNKNFYW
jgi:beta-galactosidase